MTEALRPKGSAGTPRVAMLEALVARHAVAAIRVTVDRVDVVIDALFRDLGELIGADRVYVFRLVDMGRRLTNTHEWCAPGITPQIQNLKALPVESFPWSLERLAQRSTIHIPDVSALPPEAASERAVLEAQDIKSLLCVPMFRGDRCVGFVGFDAVVEQRVWDLPEVELLHGASELLLAIFDRTEGQFTGGEVDDIEELLASIATDLALARDALEPSHPASANVVRAETATSTAVGVMRQLHRRRDQQP